MLVIALFSLAAGLVLAVLLFYAKIDASRARLSGEVEVVGLGARVEIARDGSGVPSIRAQSREDASFALGFLHGQERFFQMDLVRRSAAGELSALVGAGALPLDRAACIHRFRERATTVVGKMSAADRRILDAYVKGVNQGVGALSSVPFEYTLLRSEPEPWTAQDSILVVYAMFMDLYDASASYERALGTMHDTLPPGLVSFLAPLACEPEAPLAGVPMLAPLVPGPGVIDIRRDRPVAFLPPAGGPLASEEAPGSNNWAVAGWRSGHQRAMVANDMHLGTRVPNTWYRAMIFWPDGEGGQSKVVGVTLPGAPAVVAGSNGHVAWGLTNSYGDYVDVVIVEPDPEDPGSYLTMNGPRRLDKKTVQIEVRDQPDRQVTFLSTIWGPVIGKDARSRMLALRFTAHDPESINLGIMALEGAADVTQALGIAAASGIPPQNFTCADAQGHIGWTVAGRIPRRSGFEGRFPVSWADGTAGWDGYHEPREYPRVYDPPSGIIWTANARVVGGEDLARIGDGGYALGARARQIRDALEALDEPTEKDLLAVQLDDRALFLAPWREHLLALLDEKAIQGSALRASFRSQVEGSWTGHASVDSVGYRLVRTYRLELFAMVYGWLTSACSRADPAFDPSVLRQWEASMWRIIDERPGHLLHPDFSSWDEAMLAAVDRSIERCVDEAGSIEACTWGAHNTTEIHHPITHAVPWLGRFLDMKPCALPGDSHMPRFQAPSEGASERFVISPGHEEDALFHMPCGQSGHPLSPNYRDGHSAWEHGLPTPLLPGEVEDLLVLLPGSGA